MFTSRIRIFLFGIITSISLVSVLTYASGPDGVFGDYFQNMINNSLVCSDPNVVVTGFDNTPSNYGTKVCRTIKDLVSTLGIFNISGNIGIGTNNPGAELSVSGSIQIKDGTEWNGKVLTSNANGKASWQDLSGAGIEIINGTKVCNMPSYEVLLDSSGNPLTKDNAFCALTGIDDDTTVGLSVWEWLINLNASWQWQYRFAADCWWAVHQVKCVKFNLGLWGGGGGGSVAWSWWEDVPLTDTADFDVSCLYRMQTANLWWASYRYSAWVGTSSLFFWYNLKTWWVWWSVSKNDKGTFDIGSWYGSYSVVKLAKNCSWWSTSGWTWWENVPLADTADFDVACEYRYKLLYVVDDENRKWSNSTFWWGYPSAIHPKYLWQIKQWNYYYGVSSVNKSKYAYRDEIWNEVSTPNVVVDIIEKRCWNSSQPWYSKVCDVAYAAPSFAAPTSSHMHSIPVPDSWTSEMCRWYMWQTKWWAPETHYRLGCINSTSVSQGTYSSINAWSADAWIPANNCGW